MILITLIRGDDEDGDGDDDEYDNDDDYSQGWEEVGGGERDPEASGQHHEGRARPSQNGLIFLKKKKKLSITNCPRPSQDGLNFP